MLRARGGPHSPSECHEILNCFTDFYYRAELTKFQMLKHVFVFLLCLAAAASFSPVLAPASRYMPGVYATMNTTPGPQLSRRFFPLSLSLHLALDVCTVLQLTCRGFFSFRATLVALPLLLSTVYPDFALSLSLWKRMARSHSR